MGDSDFNGENYEDQFVGKLVNFVANDRFQSLFENFFLTHALVGGWIDIIWCSVHALSYSSLYLMCRNSVVRKSINWSTQRSISSSMTCSISNWKTSASR